MHREIKIKTRNGDTEFKMLLDGVEKRFEEKAGWVLRAREGFD